MSQENVEIVQRWIEAYNRRDMDGLIQVSAPDIEFRSIFVAVETEFRDHKGLFAYFGTLDDAYERFVVLPEHMIDAGAAVLMLANAEWRGKTSGAEGTTPIATAFWLRAGKVFRAETFTDHSEALEAVGLPEGGPP
jgi:ketosteroid isomerase-like protein